jgi:uncharacterized protein (DUF58 family)
MVRPFDSHDECLIETSEVAVESQTPTKQKKQLTPLFSNSVLSRIERMRLNPRRRQTNRSRGEHLSGKGGSSTDFADYRSYVDGDDLRYIDWNIFARLRKPYMKQFQHEEEMHIVIIIDASSSMLFEDKFLRAKQLAAAMGVIGLLNVERVSVYACNTIGRRPVLLPPTNGRAGMKRLLAFINELEGGGDLPIEEAVQNVLRLHRGKGVAIILSDFLSFGDVTRSFNMLFSAGLEIFAAQILSNTELNPELTGDMRLVDSETRQTLDISSAGDLLGLYHEHLGSMAAELGHMCRKRNGRFATVNASTPIQDVLFDQMCRQGWVLR